MLDDHRDWDTPKPRMASPRGDGKAARATSDAATTNTPPGGIRTERRARYPTPGTGGRDRERLPQAAKLAGRGQPTAARPRRGAVTRLLTPTEDHRDVTTDEPGGTQLVAPSWTSPRKDPSGGPGERRDVRGRGRVANARHIPPTFPRTSTNLQSRLWLLPLRHLSTRPPRPSL